MNQVDNNLIVKTDQRKVIDVRETGDILVSCSVRVPWADNITITDVRSSVHIQQKERTETVHHSGKTHRAGECDVLDHFPILYSKCRPHV